MTGVQTCALPILFATRWGLGYYIFLKGTTLMDYPAMYAGIVAMSLLGLILFFSIDAAEKRLCPWRAESPLPDRPGSDFLTCLLRTPAEPGNEGDTR